MCKEEQCPRTRPLEKGRGQQYGIPEEAIPPGARVCNTCQCKSVRSRYTSCPLPTCPNPKDRVKRFRNLPPRLFELAPEIRDPLIQEFQIPPNVTKCCSACLIKIKRKLGPHLLGTNLTEEEIAKFKTLLQDVGPKWPQLAESLNKTAVALKSFYFHYKKKYSFDLAVTEYYKLHPSEERRAAITDGDESDLSTSSCDEREGGSDTASAESPKIAVVQSNLAKDEGSMAITVSATPVGKASFEDDRLLPPLGQAPRKQKTTEEYDSSATETADEENETSPGNRQSPKVLHYPGHTTITMVPNSSMQNGPRDGIGSEMNSRDVLNVRDVMLNVIERSLKSGQQPPPTKPLNVGGSGPLTKGPIMDTRADITYMREYRNDVPKMQQQHQPPPNLTPQPAHPQNAPPSHQLRTSQPEGLATLSVVNSHGHTQQILSQHAHPIATQIAATITPVQAPSSQQQPQQLTTGQQQPPGTHDMQKDNMVVYSSRSEPEPQTLDLSIKKPQRDNFPPPAHSKPIPGSGVAMYRSDPHATVQSIVSQNSTFLGYHPHDPHNRPSKSPSVFVSAVPSSGQISITQQPPPAQHSIQNLRVHNVGQQHPQAMVQPLPGKSKATPKLSPKIQQHQSPNQPGGPKGSITHGTPVNSSGPSILVQGPATLSPRFDGILRQTPPTSDKLGSITQGTPVHLPSHHLNDKQRVYEYYKNSRQSPAQPGQQQASPQAPPTFGSPYQVRAPGNFSIEQPQQLSSRQIIMNDYITSQQMHGQQVRGGRSDKESPSPRSAGVAGSPASLYYGEKEQRQRAEYLSRSSPAEHVNRLVFVYFELVFLKKIIQVIDF